MFEYDLFPLIYEFMNTLYNMIHVMHDTMR